MNRSLLKKTACFSCLMTAIGAIGGFLVGMYTFAYYTEEMRSMILQQVGSETSFYLLTVIQSAIYSLIASSIGYILSDRIGLMRPLGLRKETVMRILPGIIAMSILFFLDYPVSGRLMPEVKAEYAKGISLPYFLASLIYGGITEEILLRLFMLSLIAFVINLIARRDPIGKGTLEAANIISALLFAAGHIPATLVLFGRLDAPILLRCFILNGGFGYAFGRYYIKHGIQYAMLAHFSLHLISKLLLLAVL